MKFKKLLIPLILIVAILGAIVWGVSYHIEICPACKTLNAESIRHYIEGDLSVHYGLFQGCGEVPIISGHNQDVGGCC